MSCSVIFTLPNLANETGLFVVKDDVLVCVFLLLLFSCGVY